MAFVRHRGKTKLMYFRKTDATAASIMTAGALVGLTPDSGVLQALLNDSTDKPIGVARLSIAAADTAGWPGAPFVPIEVPVENMVEWRVDVDTEGGAADSDVGHHVNVDTGEAGDSGGSFVDMGDTFNPILMITGRESATVVFGVLLNLAGTYANDTNDTGG